MYKSISYIFPIVAFLLALCTASPCRAESTDELSVNWLGDSVFTVTAGAMWITSELLKSDIAPSECIWCQSNPMDAPITDALAWSDPPKASTTADVTAFGILPAFAVASLLLSSGLDHCIDNAGVDLMLVGETIAISSLINQVVKFSVGRKRPFVERGHLSYYSHRNDDNLSFYSGHTSLAFAIVVAAGTIAHIRHYDVEPYIWGIGLPLAAFVGYTRIAGEKHYFSDVLVGALIGSAIGFLVPWLHKHESDPQGSTNSAPESRTRTARQFLWISGSF